MGKPMKVTRESCHERLNMKTMTPVALTMLRRKMLMFCETRSLTMVVSEVSREIMSPVRDPIYLENLLGADRKHGQSYSVIKGEIYFPGD